MKAWSDFVESEADRLRIAGVPVPPMSHSEFVYLLMHGDHPDYDCFDSRRLVGAAKVALRELAIVYVRRFGNPGISLFSPEEDSSIVDMALNCDQDTFIIKSTHPASHRAACFEDDGVSGWLYLTAAGGKEIEKDVWVHNRIEAPDDLSNYGGGPPPATNSYCSLAPQCQSPSAYNWSFLWSKDGESVALLRDENPVSMILAQGRRGLCKNLFAEGPWGTTWSQAAFERTF